MKARFLSPELATLVKEPFSREGWIFEEKFDGIRCIAVKVGGHVKLYSRNRKLLNDDFPEIVKTLQGRGPDFVVDGEVVAFEGKVTSFEKLQNRKREKMRVYYYMFDLLVWKDEDLRKQTLIERKKKLRARFTFGGPVRYTTHVKKAGEAFFKRAEKKGLEGVIAKLGDAPYRGGRTRDWLKFKCVQKEKFYIGGYTDPQRSRVGFGALLVGRKEGGKLKYAGKVGTGYDEKVLRQLSERLKKLERKSSPFGTQPKEKGVHYVRPTLVAEIGFTEWTKAGRLRHPKYMGLTR